MQRRAFFLLPATICLLVLLAGCDTTVQEGDTNITVFLDQNGNLDSLDVDGGVIEFPDFGDPGEDEPEGDNEFGNFSYLDAYDGSWKPFEVIPAEIGQSEVAITTERRLEIMHIRHTNIGLLVLVTPSSPAALRCLARFNFDPVNTGQPNGPQESDLKWMAPDCTGLEFKTVPVTMSIINDTLHISGNNFAAMAAMAVAAADSPAFLPSQAITVRFARTSEACTYLDC